MTIGALPIVLSSSTGTLTFTLDQEGVGGWCQVHLLVSGVRRPLGAEQWTYIAAHLASFLADNSTGRRWVFSLSELHFSAYGEHAEGSVVIYLQDAHGNMAAELVLTAAERERWIHGLSKHTGA